MLGGLTARLFAMQLTGSPAAAPAAAAAPVPAGVQIVTEPVPSTRGLIYDRSKHLLVENVPTFTVSILPADLPLSQQPQVVGSLAGLLGTSATAITDGARQRERLAVRSRDHRERRSGADRAPDRRGQPDAARGRRDGGGPTRLPRRTPVHPAAGLHRADRRDRVRIAPGPGVPPGRLDREDRAGIPVRVRTARHVRRPAGREGWNRAHGPRPVDDDAARVRRLAHPDDRLPRNSATRSRRSTGASSSPVRSGAPSSSRTRRRARSWPWSASPPTTTTSSRAGSATRTSRSSSPTRTSR